VVSQYHQRCLSTKRKEIETRWANAVHQERNEERKLCEIAVTRRVGLFFWHSSISASCSVVCSAIERFFSFHIVAVQHLPVRAPSGTLSPVRPVGPPQRPSGMSPPAETRSGRSGFR
jgi:hypothetical protein